MRISDAIEAQRNHQQRLCDALGLDPDVTADVTLNRAAGRVEWTRTWEGVDLNAYDYSRRESGKATVVVGLYVVRDISREAWDKAIAIDDEVLGLVSTAKASLVLSGVSAAMHGPAKDREREQDERDARTGPDQTRIDFLTAQLHAHQRDLRRPGMPYALCSCGWSGAAEAYDEHVARSIIEVLDRTVSGPQSTHPH